jgi:hypothetical protein
MSLIRDIEIRNLREVQFENEEGLYSEKLKSGLPIFKSIQFLRYQDNEQWVEFFGEEKPFIVDQSNIDFTQIKVDIGKIKLFLEYFCFDLEMNRPFPRSIWSLPTRTKLKLNTTDFLPSMRSRSGLTSWQSYFSSTSTPMSIES